LAKIELSLQNGLQLSREKILRILWHNIDMFTKKYFAAKNIRNTALSKEVVKWLNL